MTLRLTTLMYHYVRPAAELSSAGYGGLDVGAFRNQLDEICRHATPVGWPAVAAAIEGSQALPSDAVLLTFDDGLVDHKRHVLPELVARGLTGVFFVLARTPTDGLTLGHRLHVLIAALGSASARQAIVERLSTSDRQKHAALEAEALVARPSDPQDAWKRPLQREMARSANPVLGRLIADRFGREDELARALYLDESDLYELKAAGMDLGGHGREHLWLDFEDPATIRSELRASTAVLDRFNVKSWAFAYPYGGVSSTSVKEVERAGFTAAFTTVRRTYARFRIGRIDGDAVGPTEVSRVIRA